MFDRFTERARKVMALARKEAQRFNHDFIGTGHILLGLIKKRKGVVANILRNLNVDINKIRHEIEKNLQPGPSMITMGQLPFTPRAKKVLELSMEEANDLRHNYIGTEHLLLGLLRESDGEAAQVLQDLGLKLEEVRGEVFKMLGAEMSSIKRFEKIVLVDGEGKVRATMDIREDGSPFIEFNDAQGIARLILGLGSEGAPLIEFKDADGNVTHRIPGPNV